MATRKISSTAVARVTRSFLSSPCSQLRRPATTRLLLSSIGSTKSRFSAKYPFKHHETIFGQKALSYSTAAKSTPPQIYVTYWKQLFKKVHLSAKTMKDGFLATSRCQNVVEQGKCETLDNYRNDLTNLARHGKLNPILGREDEIERCIQILSRETKNNPIIIGDTGKERTEIVEGLAQQIIHGDVSEMLVNRKLISLDTDSLRAGTKSREHFEQRLEAVLKEITASNDQIILFIDEIHTIVGAGGRRNGGVDVGNMLYSMLGRGDLQIVGATTCWGYRKYIQDLDREDKFQKVLCEDQLMIRLISLMLTIIGMVLFLWLPQQF